MTEELKVVLRRSEHSGFGFSLLGTTGPPHVIYDIVENSPAADCGVVEAGDIILKINGIDVHCYTTKEVLKCLRLSDDLVTLELKRDPELKARIKEQLANSRSPHYAEVEAENIYNYKCTTNRSPTHSSPRSEGLNSSNSSNLNVDIGTTSPLSLRYNKSPTTNLPHLQTSPLTSTAVTRHSRSSSASSAKTQIIETNINNPAAVSPTASGRSTSPTSRPSRIPTALKSPLKPTGVHNSPQHKRPRPSQIPTKAMPIVVGYVASSYNQDGTHSQQHEQYSQQDQCFQHEVKQRDVAPKPITPPQPVKGPRFEAYMMTGDLMLNLSRTQQSNLLPAHAKKVDSLRDSPKRVRANGALAPCATSESSPTSSSSMEYTISIDSGSMQNQNKTRTRQTQKPLLQQQQQKQKQEQDQRGGNVNINAISAGFERQYYTQLVTTDTLVLCEEQEKDMEYQVETEEDNNYRQQPEKRCYIRHREKYAHHQVDEEGDRDQNRRDQHFKQRGQKHEEEQTHLDISNSETYRDGSADESSERQCLVMHYENKDEKVKQRPRSSKQQRTMLRYKIPGDSIDFARSQSHNLCGTRGSGSSSSSATVKSDCVSTSQDETSFSVPNSPISLSTCVVERDAANSVPTSPELSYIGAVGNSNNITPSQDVACRHNGIVRKCDSAGFRTSKSEDHLQQTQREGNAAVIPIDIDEDVNSSLNTLLDTRQDSEDSQVSNPDRIVWTYNAPVPSHLQQQHQQQYAAHYGHNSSSNTQYHSHSHSHSHSSSLSSSPQHSSGSPTSPTSVSSSVMSSSGSKSALGNGGTTAANSNDHQRQQQPTTGVIYGTGSATEAIASTTSVSDAAIQRQKQQEQQKLQQSEHKVVIQVRGIDSSNIAPPRSAYSELKDSEDELTTLTEEQPTAQLASAGSGGEGHIERRDYSPPISDDGSDAESLHSYHYSPKGVDLPSAIRLAKRLYSLDGFKKSDVSRHLSKNNDFSRVVADEYLKYFNFEKKTLEQALREFLRKFALSGETQERERVLLHFSKRYLDSNPGTFNSQDAVHTLTCAIMLLNTDLHGQNIGRKMSCVEFVENLAELNDGENFPKDVLKSLYQAIKSQPLEWALDDEVGDMQKQRLNNNANASAGGFVNQVPFLNMPEPSSAVEYKKGYVMRKCCYESNYKKTPFGKRSWKMFYCTLRDLVLYLHKDEHGFRKCQMSDNLHNAIRIHHALATKATDYAKKQHVFRLQTADQAEYLFQTSDSKELQSWVETINFVCAAYSAPPLEGGVGSQKRFQRPLLPSAHTKLLLKEQLTMHEQQLVQLENALLEHKKGPVPTKGLPLQNYKEKESYLTYELGRYKAYVSILSAKLIAEHQQLIEKQQEGLSLANEEESDTFPLADGGAVRCQPQQQVQTSSIITSMKQQKQHQTQPAETRYQNQPDLG